MTSCFGPKAALVSCLAFAAAPVMAATLEPINVADVTRVDDLGFACIEEEDLEMAYAATGKKDGLLPRTCLPKPCVRMIDQDALGQQIGRTPTEEEWADYVSRYAELCVAETGGAWPEDVMFANASSPVTNDTFWDGLAGVPLNSGVGSDVLAGVPGGAGSFTPGIVTAVAGRIPGSPGSFGRAGGSARFGPQGLPGFIGGSSDGDDGDDGKDGKNGKGGMDGEDGEDGFPAIPGTLPTPPLTPVPLPASMALLLGAFGFTWAARQVSARRQDAH